MDEDEREMLVEIRKEVGNLKEAVSRRMFINRFWKAGAFAIVGAMLTMFSLAVYYFVVLNYPENLPLGLFFGGCLFGVISLFIAILLDWGNVENL